MTTATLRKRPVRTDLEFSLNTESINKPLNNHYTTFSSNNGTIDDILSYVKKGFAVSPSQFKNRERKASNVIQSGLVIVDIDNQAIVDGSKVYKHGITIEEALNIPFIKEHCKIYTTCSHTEQWNRFRIILPMPQAIDADTYKVCVGALNEMLNNAIDTVASIPSTGFYGNTQAWVSDNEISGLGWDWLTTMQDSAKLVKEAREATLLEQKQKELSSDEKVPSTEIEKLLQYISSDCDYGTWTQVCCAIGNTTSWSTEGLDMFDNWSLTGNPKKYSGRKFIENKWYSFRGDIGRAKITIGTLVYLAKQGGYIRSTTVKEPSSKETYTATHIESTRYVHDTLTKIYGSLSQGTVLGVKAPKNTGKSYWLTQLINNSDKKFVLMGDRRVLTKSLSDENNLNYLTQDDDADDAVRYYEDYGKLSCVVDSALKLGNLYIDNSVLVIDEAEQFIESLLTGQTHIKKYRGQILGMLREKLPWFDTIILCDADLTDDTVEFFAEIGNMTAVKYHNTFKENSRDCHVYQSVSKLNAVMEKVLADGGKIMYVTDSQRQAEALRRVVAKRGIKSILLTRDSLSNKPELHHYLANKGQKIKDSNIQAVFVSPVMQSGVSIELGDYFSGVFGNFQGVIAPKTASQLLARDRSNCDRHVYHASSGIKVPQFFTVAEVLENESAKQQSLLDVLAYLQYTDPTVIQTVKLNDVNAPDLFYGLISQHKARIISSRNASLQWYGSVFHKQLRLDGYNVKKSYSEEKSTIDIKSEVDTLVREEATRIHIAPTIDEYTKKRLETKDALNDAEKAMLGKSILLSTLPNLGVDVDEEFIYKYALKDRYTTIKAVENHYLVDNKDKALDKDISAIKSASQMSSDLPFVEEIKCSTRLVLLWDKLNLSQYSTQTSTGVDMKQFQKLCLKNKRLLKVFGITVLKTTYPLKLLRAVLAIFGITIKQRTSTSGRVYIPVKCELFDIFYTSINERYEINKAKKEQKEKEKAKKEQPKKFY